MKTLLIKLGLPILYVAALIVPAVSFFSRRGGLDFLVHAPDLKTFSLLLFPLVGLYAFTLVWVQLILGSSLPIWIRVYPWIFAFHRVQGIFALLFAGLHPTLLLFAYGAAYFDYPFVATEQKLFIYIGQIQLVLLFAAVGAALLRKTKFMKRWWRYVHWANYAVFALVWIHSWFLGTDVRGTWLVWVWMFFGLTALISFVGRLIRGSKTRRAMLANRAQNQVQPSN